MFPRKNNKIFLEPTTTTHKRLVFTAVFSFINMPHRRTLKRTPALLHSTKIEKCQHIPIKRKPLQRSNAFRGVEQKFTCKITNRSIRITHTDDLFVDGGVINRVKIRRGCHNRSILGSIASGQLTHSQVTRLLGREMFRNKRFQN